MKPIGIIIFIILLAGGIALIYFNYNPNNIKKFVNLSISAEYNNQKIKTGFKIGDIEGNTSQYYELIQVKEGMIKIKNINLKDQNFYEEERIINASGNKRVDLELKKPDIPKIEVIKLNPLLVSISSKIFKNPIICLKGSVNYISIKANLSEIKKPEEFQNYDGCYSMNSLKNSKEIIEISYLTITIPTKKDYLNLTMEDSQKNIKNVKLI